MDPKEILYEEAGLFVFRSSWMRRWVSSCLVPDVWRQRSGLISNGLLDPWRADHYDFSKCREPNTHDSGTSQKNEYLIDTAAKT
jgi:hypothetical protein